MTIVSVAGLTFCLIFLQVKTTHALTLLTKKEALVSIFGKSAQVVIEKKELKGDVLERIKKRLGGQLVHFQQDSESEQVTQMNEITFYFVVRNGKRVGTAIVDVEPGKWGPVEFIIAMDFKPTIRAVKVMSYVEKRGRPIARSSFMNQYKGKTGKNTLTVGKDITGIAGATISSRSATFAVKKALVLFEEFYLNK